MPLVLNRVDDRLVHGQVVVGWGQPLRVQRVILVDDAVAASDWEQELYRMAVPPGLALTFATQGDAAAQLAGWQADPQRTILLTGDLDTMAALYAADGVVLREINIGGVHQRPGRTERLPYVFLTDAEYGLLERMAAAGAHIQAQDVPTAAPVGLTGLRR